MKRLSLFYTMLILFTIFIISGGCSHKPERPDKEPSLFRIGVAMFIHETCTFCPEATGVEEFEFYGPPVRGEELLTANEYIRGFVSKAEEYGGVELVGLLSPREAKGGSSGSWITTEAFEKYTNTIIEDIKQYGPFDGIYLSLHGAMAVSGIPKPEAEMVRRIREFVGEIPIIITLDLHANVDHELSDAADAIFIVKRYPHYDSWLQGERAARIMIRTLRNSYKPVMATRKPGVITPSVFQGTGVSPAMEIMERARRWEARRPDVFVSVAFGFAYADVPDVGATVMVITDKNQKLADEIADDMSGYIWRMRGVFAGKRLPKTKEGVSLSIEAAKGGKVPVVIADHSDRTGNSTHILEELIRQDAVNFCIATIADEKAIDKLRSDGRKKGDHVKLTVGGYADKYAGNPVEIEGVLEYFNSYGHFDKVAILLFGKNNRVIITPQLHQVTTPDIFDKLNIDLNTLEIISLKSRVHFRRGFYENGLAGAIFEVDAPGLGPADLSEIPYKNIPKDIYPIFSKE
jgi:microcystin degradation protein MlrC